MNFPFAHDDSYNPEGSAVANVNYAVMFRPEVTPQEKYALS